MKKNMISTIVCCIAATAGTVMLSAGPLCAPLPFASESAGLVMNVEAATVGKTKTQAVNWIQNAANTKWCVDVDGAYGCQCVDLVMGYYQFLGCRSYAKGNGKDYAKNALPAGWTRISKPKLTDIKAGDIVVWGAGAALTTSGGKAHATYGHVGLVLKDGTRKGFTTVETRGSNANNLSSCISR